MHVVIAQVDKVFFDGPARSLTAPGSEGVLTVLPRHMPLITTLKKGTIVVRTEQGQQEFPVEGGILEVRPDGATVIL